MNIHYDVTGLLTVVWRSHSGQIVWPAGVGQGRGEFSTHSTYTRSHAIEMVFVFIATEHAGSSARSFMPSFFFKTLGHRSGSISGH